MSAAARVHTELRPCARRLRGGALTARILNIASHPDGLAAEDSSASASAVVRIRRDHAGRGPATAHAFSRRNIVVVIVGDGMTTEEHSLTAAGNLATAVQMRRESREAMRADLVAAVARARPAAVSSHPS